MNVIMTCLLFLPFVSTSQISNLPSANSLYVFSRSTVSKSGIIARDFNIKDSFITHVGIGFWDGCEFVIYHISPNKSTTSTQRLYTEDTTTFFSTQGTNYISIWAYSSSQKQIAKLKSILKSYTKKDYCFDESFLLHNNDSMYCSEFVYRVLTDLDSTLFNFPPQRKELNALYRKILGRKYLEYIPVDFFETIKGFYKFYDRKI